MAVYNPLLDMFATDLPPVVERPWLVVCERVNGWIERAVRKANQPEVFKWINVMDLLCDETAAYWRETGWRVYGDSLHGAVSSSSETSSARIESADISLL